jgi:poly-gamma-glutamate synthesis protein (capsule biosynthesis protein)
MKKWNGLTTLLAALLLAASCNSSQPSEPGIEADDDLNVVLLGQALIEHDPRSLKEAPLESVVPLLTGADVVFTNLEVSVCAEAAECKPTRTDEYFHGAGPRVIDYLDSIGVNLLSLANNHAWDYGSQGILSGIEEVSGRGIVHAGTGKTISDAVAPAYLDVRGNRVALVAAASAKLKPEAPATSERPGVNVLLPGDTEAWDRNIASIREAAGEADLVIAYQHFQSLGTHEWQRDWAKAAIDAGADIYVSHGEPVLSGIELYNGGLIFYGLGNFIFHTRSEIGHYPREVWESLLVRLSLKDGHLIDAEFIPVVIDEGEPGPDFLQKRGYPSIAQGGEATAILEAMVKASREYGTEIEVIGQRGRLRNLQSP